MAIKCDICGHTTAEKFEAVVKQGKKVLKTATVCRPCLESKHLIEPKEDDFQKNFEELTGNPYLGSDFN